LETDSARKALMILRDPAQFRWYVVPMLLLVLYVYANEIERRRWSVVFAGLAFWGMDWVNEIVNALVFHFTGRAPIWGAPGATAYLLLIGINIEITFTFAVLPIVFAKLLPPDPKMTILGIPNRLFIALAGSISCVIVEYILNSANALTWDWWWWNRRAPWLIVIFGYLTFFLVSFRVFDMKTLRSKITTVGALLGFDAACLAVFGGMLGWI